MRDVELFQAALGLSEPWRVVGSSFDAGQRRLELRIDFERGARFACPQCDVAGCEVHDATQKTWRHLDFFQHQAFLVARVARVRCAAHGVRQVLVPWARAGSGFTLLFEALVMALVAEMPVGAVGELVGEHDTRIWRIVHHYVDRALARQDLSTVTRVAVDETSFRRGQDYVSVFACLDQARVVFATPGRDADAYARFTVLRSLSWKSSQRRLDGQLAAAEVDEGDEWGGSVEAEAAVGEQADLGVEAFHAAVGQAEADGGQDGVAAGSEGARELDERLELAA